MVTGTCLRGEHWWLKRVAQHQLGLGVGVVAAYTDADLVEQAAVHFYGDAELYRLIATASGIADPAVIEVGNG